MSGVAAVLVALAGDAAAIGAVRADGGQATAWLRSRPLVAGGPGSYSLYLWHLPVSLMVRKEALGRNPRCGACSASPSPPRLAWLCYRYVERPWRIRRAAAMAQGPTVPTAAPAALPRET